MLCITRNFIFVCLSPRNDLESIIWPRPLQCLGLSHGARIQTSRSSSVVKITGIGLGSIGSTIAEVRLTGVLCVR
jgi:hypothetical protein